MVSINTIAILFLFGAIAIGGAFAFSRISGFFRNFQLPSLGDISLPRPFIGPERQDVDFPSPAREAAGLPPIDIVPEFGRQDPRRPEFEVRPPIDIISPAGINIGPFLMPEVVPELGRRDPRREALAPIVEKPDPIIGPRITGFGGPSFEGGQILETPLENLSLNQIIENLGVSASKAASLRARAIGFDPQETAFLQQNPLDVGGFVDGGPPAVTAGLGFEGLSLEEIARRIGQPISNF